MKYEALLKISLLLVFITLVGAKRWASLTFSDPCLEKRMCPNNEEFICCGPCVEPTCFKPNPRKKCGKVCVAGCFCQPNYIRRVIGGPCVLADSCPPLKKVTKTP
ncbi:cysteine-rich venom protein 1-like [Anopheles moucheti]|uniref:cysteine-rich venom protein 1-like n=1 Tax=Anopheles moucheti TaxID=186751 RepID=UPI0022F0FC45|nr:cysteine-rich venom protein 1-like [Anopheles moucheti]